MTVKPQWTFYVKHTKRGVWWRYDGRIRVDVFRTKRELRLAYHEGTNPDHPLTGPDAVCGYVLCGDCQPDICWMGLSATTGIGVLSHEATHAAHRACLYDETGQCSSGTLRFAMDGEPVALAVGNIVREIVCKFHALGIWKK
jgi:hypothetical protein